MEGLSNPFDCDADDSTIDQERLRRIIEEADEVVRDADEIVRRRPPPLEDIEIDTEDEEAPPVATPRVATPPPIIPRVIAPPPAQQANSKNNTTALQLKLQPLFFVLLRCCWSFSQERPPVVFGGHGVRGAQDAAEKPGCLPRVGKFASPANQNGNEICEGKA